MKKWIHVLLITFGAVCATLLAISHSSSLYAQTSSGDWGCWITVDESVPVTKCAWDTHDWGNGDYTTLAGDINGDGKADRILYRATDGDWGCWLTSYATKCRWDTQKWGTADYMPLLGDIDGDGRADRILYRAQDGDWGCQLANGEKCNWDAEKWGTIDYVPLIGDVNGDGKVDRILYSPRDGDWGCLLTGKDQSNPEKCNWDTEDWGDASYVPMLGDVNGDGKADRILYRATDGDWGCWFTDVKEPDKQKCNWDTDDWGSADYTPLIGDVNGDGKVDRMLYRPADGDWGCWITDAPDRDRPKCAWDAQDWGNANYVPLVADVDGDGKADRILHESLPTQRVINLSISLYKTAGTEEERAPYVGILKHFADAIYEMSNGRHTLGKVTIFQNGMNSNTADILWVNTEWPHVPGGCISGVGKAGCHINTGDTYPFSTPYNATHAANWQGAGYTLAHEWGHYYYGLFDEYNGSAACNDTPANIFQLQTCDSMPNSVMNNQWHARNNNYNWLNFGVAVNQTRHNVNWRVYGASGWEVLARSPQLDPRDGQRRRSTRLTYFPELASVAPASTSSSPIELPNANSRSHLQIHWIAPPAISHAAVATNSDDYQPMVRLANSNALWYPEAAILVATLAKEGGFIAKSDIMATVAAPDSTIETITFHDDGIAPDLEADDGLYTASWLYTQNGKHLI
ncbi:MAG: hypothetical protein KDE53_35120, partial [Caldilineaceae bacterium]|nr:hypothetical protein [Caldilineaceae bacterium]